MKISLNKFEEYLLPSAKDFSLDVDVILIFGPDQSSVRNYTGRCLQKLTDIPPDPFKVHQFSWNNSQEMASQIAVSIYEISLFGGRKIIHVRQINDHFTNLLKDLPPPAPARERNLLLLEADDLSSKSSLRRFVEADQRSLAIACYLLDEREQISFIEKTLHQTGLRTNQEGLLLLKGLLPNQKQTILNEIQKLALYCKVNHPQELQSVSAEEILACLAEQREISLQDLVNHFAGQQISLFIQNYYRCINEGENPISIIRFLTRSLQQFWLTRVAMQTQRLPAEQAMGQLKPPVFYQHQQRFLQNLRLWPLERLMQTFLKLTELEIHCKKSGVPGIEIALQQLLALISSPTRAVS